MLCSLFSALQISFYLDENEVVYQNYYQSILNELVPRIMFYDETDKNVYFAYENC